VAEEVQMDSELSPEEAQALKALRRLAELQQTTSTRRTYRHNDFLYDISQDAFWCRPLSAMISAKGVNSMVPIEHWRLPKLTSEGRQPPPVPPAKDLMRIEAGTVVEGSTWLPGQGELIEDLYASKDGFFPIEGVQMFNTFRPGPVADVSLAPQAMPWVEHIKRLWPETIEHEYFFDYCAHMIQKPEEKANGAIVVSGKQGIGKDAALLPVRMAVGEWNTRNISPDHLFQQFNPWVECVMLTIDEVRPMSDDHKATSLYDILKSLTVTPPNTIALNDKRDKLRYIANVLRLFLTTNDRLALYIPPEDRRLMMMHSELPQRWHRETDPDYFVKLFNWLTAGGYAAVAGWLAARDISKFNPKGEVPKTSTWAEISQRWDAPEDELTAALDSLGNPDCLFSTELIENQFDGVEELRKLMKGRGFVFRMQQAGYKVVPLPEGKTRWRKGVNGWEFKSFKAYIKENLCLGAAQALERVEERLQLRVDAGPKGKVPKGPRLSVVGESINAVAGKDEGF